MSAAVAAAAAAASISYKSSSSRRRSSQSPKHLWVPFYRPSTTPQQPVISPYETQKPDDWNAFRQYLKKHRPGLILSRCTGVNVIEFLDDQFGNIKTHARNCPFFENPDSPSQSQSPGSCPCPLMQSWSSLNGLVRRLRVAFEENGGRSGMNPFSAGVVRVYISQVKDAQAKPRGMAYSQLMNNN